MVVSARLKNYLQLWTPEVHLATFVNNVDWLQALFADGASMIDDDFFWTDGVACTAYELAVRNGCVASAVYLRSKRKKKIVW